MWMDKVYVKHKLKQNKTQTQINKTKNKLKPSKHKFKQTKHKLKQTKHTKHTKHKQKNSNKTKQTNTKLKQNTNRQTNTNKAKQKKQTNSNKTQTKHKPKQNKQTKHKLKLTKHKLKPNTNRQNTIIFRGNVDSDKDLPKRMRDIKIFVKKINEIVLKDESFKLPYGNPTALLEFLLRVRRKVPEERCLNIPPWVYKVNVLYVCVLVFLFVHVFVFLSVWICFLSVWVCSFSVWVFFLNLMFCLFESLFEFVFKCRMQRVSVRKTRYITILWNIIGLKDPEMRVQLWYEHFTSV